LFLTKGKLKTFRSRKILPLKDGGKEEKREGGNYDTKRKLPEKACPGVVSGQVWEWRLLGTARRAVP